MESSTKDSGISEKMDLLLERPHSRADAERVVTKNTDAVELAHLGHKDELQRRFSLPSLLGLCLCLMGTWEACSASIAAALTSGDPPCLWYNFTTCSRLGTDKTEDTFRKTASWLTGRISIGGQVVLLASAGFYSSFMVQGLISLSNPSYQAERWHATLIYIGILIYCAMLNVIGEKVLPTANFISGALHILGFLAVLIALGVTSKKNTSGYVFTTTFNNTNWSDGVAWIVGMICYLLGKVLGIFLNVAAIIWMVVSIIFSLFPSSLPVTLENMNYSVAVMSGWIILGAVHFAFVGRKKFKMPVVAANVVEGMHEK
ncbi:HNM1-choline permease [Fusarium circinatum]|uniref:HNM1-choline permease n=1 Tax=Fusarium circinatum TaxID=48490 RepID=A0A8H5T4G8_FUSCI|nr:HNM1-choline permease [Fusarium circinatum]